MQAEVKWVEEFKFLGQSQSGHSIVMDGNGGATAPSPMEMVNRQKFNIIASFDLDL